MVRRKFSWRITVIGVLLVAGMLRLSYWQWERYLAKEEFLAELDQRIELPIIPLAELLQEGKPWKELLHRRVSVSGDWEFSYEVIKRNRRDDADGPGVHVVTPLKFAQGESRILINRGFLPFSVKSRDAREQFQATAPKKFVGLIKLSEEPRWSLSPQEEVSKETHPITGKEWRDRWLRVDIEKIEKQLPFTLLPIHLELMSTTDQAAIGKALVKNSKSREEIFYLDNSEAKVSTGSLNPERSYPVPAFSTVVPSATHLLYVFEWAFMALLTAIICILLQMKSRTSYRLFTLTTPRLEN